MCGQMHVVCVLEVEFLAAVRAVKLGRSGVVSGDPMYIESVIFTEHQTTLVTFPTNIFGFSPLMLLDYMDL